MSIRPERILYQDEHLLIVNKRSGELAVRGKGEVGKAPLFDFLHKDFPGLRVIHRLDFETSGAIAFARTKQALEATLDTKFDQWLKTYHALVMGRVLRESGDLHFPLPSRMKGEMVEAHTHFKVLERFANSSYVEASISSGRQHQIRRHFAKIEHPLALDWEYGHTKFNQTFKKEFHYERFFLHAFALDFPHPITGEKMHVEAPLPEAFAAVLKRLRELK